ncbi:hypothetical protein Hanom_Chr09g00768191 [Helianthus anomalus]
MPGYMLRAWCFFLLGLNRDFVCHTPKIHKRSITAGGATDQDLATNHIELIGICK